MTLYQKASPRAVRHATMLEVNEFLVLDYVREHGPTTRTGIARALGLSAASVGRIIGRLRAARVVEEGGSERSNGGRPRTIVSFRRDAGAIVAVDLGGTHCHVALADLAGTIQADDERSTRAQGDPFATLVASIEAMQQEAKRRDVPVVALAVGIPGILEPGTGVVRYAPYTGWEGFPLVDSLSRVVDVPFVTDNDLNLAALAHAWRGDGRLVSDFVTISVGTGVGAAIVSDGRLVKGSHNAAGEVGYLVVAPDMLGRGISGGLGAFESFASGPGIVTRAREIVKAGGQSQLAGRTITPEAVLQAASAGDALARGIVDELLDYLAMAIIAFSCTVDPDLIILEGGVGRSLGPYVQTLLARVAPSVPSPPRICTSSLGRSATVIGAVAAALELTRQRTAPPAVLGAFSLSGVIGHAD